MSEAEDLATAASAVRVVAIEAARLLRLSRFPDTEPYWGKGAQFRFDDPQRRYGVTYTALSVEVGFAEMVLHERAHFIDGHWSVSRADIDARHVVSYRRPSRPLLQLADLTGEGLKAIGLNNDISASSDYTVAMAVSRALHDSHPELDGILYVSRQVNTALAVALFERSGIERAGATPLVRHPRLAGLLDTFNVDVMGES